MQKRLVELRERLLRAGVAPRHVRRYLSELADHLADLRVEERRSGRSLAEAEAAALERLGCVEELAQAMIAKPELHGWSARAPWAVFGIGSVVGLAVAYTAACTILWIGWKVFLPGNESPFVPVDDGLAIAYFGLGRMLYFGAPVLVGWSMCVLAARQRIRWMWPAVGMAVVASIAGMVQVHAQRADAGSAWGHVSLGLTVGTTQAAILGQLAYAVSLFVAAVVPYVVWRLRRERAAQGSA
jgi:hypothetical protein